MTSTQSKLWLSLAAVSIAVLLASIIVVPSLSAYAESKGKPKAEERNQKDRKGDNKPSNNNGQNNPPTNNGKKVDDDKKSNNNGNGKKDGKDDKHHKHDHDHDKKCKNPISKKYNKHCDD